MSQINLASQNSQAQENEDTKAEAIINSYPSEPSQSEPSQSQPSQSQPEQVLETFDSEIQVGSPLYVHIQRNRLAKAARKKDKLERKLETKKRDEVNEVQKIKKEPATQNQLTKDVNKEEVIDLTDEDCYDVDECF